MSSGTTPTPIVVPAAPTDWKTIVIILLTAVSSLLSGVHIGKTPVVPPNGGGQVQPAPPPPQPPVPPPSPALVSIVDGKGNTVSGSVDPGKMIRVTGVAGTELTPVVSPGADIDLDQIAPSKINAVLRSGTLQIVVTGVGKPTITSVLCNHAPQPPTPAPVPDDKTTPSPSRKLAISIVEADAGNRPEEVGRVLESKFWFALRQKGHAFRVFDQSDDTKEAMSAKSAITTSGNAWIIIRDKSNGSLLYSGSLPETNAGAQSIVNQYLGADS